ncbi:MAG: GNAT family N-acetyltransferase [Candidatus Omnitrophica bacterium]|nr:GNAT family N-acetyltransferase [Candidatus Omnitrophota bacterium]
MQAVFNELEVGLARSEAEINQCQKLRADIFDAGNSQHPNGRECDEYDRFCDHLIVRDRKQDLIVGTYRLLPSFKAKTVGFHAEKIFDITNIKKIKGNILELGRSCIRADYRLSLVINLLWRGINEYVQQNEIDFLIGCPRLKTSDIKEISRSFLFLKKNFYSCEDLRVYPRAECKIPIIEDIEVDASEKMLRHLPPLVKGYLKTGAVVCGYPALNKEFGSTVVFMLLDFSLVNPRYRRRFSHP